MYSSIHLLHQWLAALASEVLGQCGSFVQDNVESPSFGIVVHFVYSGGRSSHPFGLQTADQLCC